MIRVLVVGALRLALLVSVVVCTVATLGESLPAACMLGVWAPVLWWCTSEAPQAVRDALVVDLLLVGLVSTKTLVLLANYGTADAIYDNLFLVPAVVACLLAAMRHLDIHTWPGTSTVATALNSPNASRRTVVGLLFLLVLAFGCGVAVISTSLFPVVGAVAESVLLLALLLAGADLDAWFAALYVVGVSLFFSPTALELWARAGFVIAAFLVACAANLAQDDDPQLVRWLKHVGRRLDRIIVVLLGSPLAYEIALLASAVVLVVSTFEGHTFYQSRLTPAQTPSSASGVGVGFCRFFLDIVDEPIRIFYQFTSDDNFQRTILFAIPQISTIRVMLYRIITQVYPTLIACVYGATALVSSTTLGSVVSAAWSVVVALAIASQVFDEPGGWSLMHSGVFWAASTVASLLALMFTQLTSDVDLVFLHSVLTDSTLERDYSDAGQYQLVAQLAMVGASLAMCVMQIPLPAVVIVAPTPDEMPLKAIVPTGSRTARLHSSKSRGQYRRINVGDEPERLKVEAGWIRRAWDELTQPALVLAAAAVMWLLVTAPMVGSPFDTYTVRPVAVTRPAWVVVTVADRVESIFGGVVVDLAEELFPGAHDAIIVSALAAYAINLIPCWGCICLPIPSLSTLESGVSGFTGLFSRRRRLLEHRVEQTGPWNSRALLQAGFPDPFQDKCSGQRQSCSDTLVCVTEVVKDIAKQVTKIATEGLLEAIQYAVGVLAALIPGFRMIEQALNAILGIAHVLGSYEVLVNLLHMPEVQFHYDASLWGLDLGRLPMWRLPTFTVDVFTLVILGALALVGLALAVHYGILKRLAHALELAIVANLLTITLGAALMVWQFADFLTRYGFAAKVVWKRHAVFLYGAGVGMLVLALILRIKRVLSKA